MFQKMYSKFSVKSFNEDKMELTGIATTPAVDRDGDIVEPLGATFEKEIPFLWEHDTRQPIGLCQLGTPTSAGIPFIAKLAKIETECELKSRIINVWEAIKARLVRAVSIRFKATEYSYIDTGVHFLKYEILELSAVTIPAQGEAVIQEIKNYEQIQSVRPIRLVSVRPEPLKNGAVRLIDRS